MDSENDNRQWLRDRGEQDGERDARSGAPLWTSAQQPPAPLTRETATFADVEAYRLPYLLGWEKGGGASAIGNGGFPSWAP